MLDDFKAVVDAMAFFMSNPQSAFQSAILDGGSDNILWIRHLKMIMRNNETREIYLNPHLGRLGFNGLTLQHELRLASNNSKLNTIIMTTEIKNKPIVMMTAGELVEVLHEALGIDPEDSAPKVVEKDKTYVYGVGGLAKLLDCSIATAQRRISSGKLDDCIIRSGRLIMIDKDAALNILKGGKV